MTENNKRLAVKVDHVFMRFNLSKEKTDNLKEYVIKLLKKQLLYTEFIALRDISFEVYQGEMVGIIGYNGSGKSTILKIIAGVMKPSAGQVKTFGSIAPLIELGAGFDPNLTGKENIYLNGYVLGYSKAYIEDKIEEIISFSELKDFIDVPLKNYSSGMKARLGFSIATSVKPEILIVDEALSVGDYKFQKKCLNRMQEMINKNTTVLFVSHSTQQVKELCTKCIWLDKGEIRMMGETEAICDAFLEEK